MIEVICGPMFSGKTEELIRRLNRLTYANRKFLLFKPNMDNRFSHINVCSHNKSKMPAIPIRYAEEMTQYITNCDGVDVIGIDEFQFFGNGLIDQIKNYEMGNKVILAGLDMDHKGEPFERAKEILPIANKVTKLSAVCVKCGDDANMSYKINKDDTIVDVGGEEKYEARCRTCWYS